MSEHDSELLIMLPSHLWPLCIAVLTERTAAAAEGCSAVGCVQHACNVQMYCYPQLVLLCNKGDMALLLGAW